MMQDTDSSYSYLTHYMPFSPLPFSHQPSFSHQTSYLRTASSSASSDSLAFLSSTSSASPILSPDRPLPPNATAASFPFSFSLSPSVSSPETPFHRLFPSPGFSALWAKRPSISPVVRHVPPRTPASVSSLSPLSSLASRSPSPTRRPAHERLADLAASDSDSDVYVPAPRKGKRKGRAQPTRRSKRSRMVSEDTDAEGETDDDRTDANDSLVVESLLTLSTRAHSQPAPKPVAKPKPKVETRVTKMSASTARANETGAGDATELPRRTFPAHIPRNAVFPLFYRRFAVPRADGPLPPGATRNAPRDGRDLYTPRFVKGRGTAKVGLCPCCAEPPTRGGEGTRVWLSMKFSAFKCYHMQYAHGISAQTGRPFSPPTAFRTLARATAGKHEKAAVLQGRCHRCTKWVAVEGIKDVPTKVKEIFWWKHAATCHQGSTIEGETDIFLEDDIEDAVADASD